MIANRVLDTCESTNILAKELGEAGYPSGTWVSAKKQTQGKGRMGRSWVSEDGNLFLSVLLRAEDQTPMTWIPLRVAVVVLECILELHPSLDIKIKWPNDLVSSRGEKYAGILCEGFGGVNGSFIVIGIGVNCKSAPDTDQKTSSVNVSSDDLRQLILKNISTVLNGDHFLIRFQDHHILKQGQNIDWYSLQCPERVLSGVFKKLGTHGELIVDCNGVEQSLWSEEIKIKWV